MILKCNAPILLRRPVGRDLWEMTFHAPEIARSARPGQFLHIRCLEEFSLRRPFSVYWTGEDQVAILFEVRGRGTRVLAEKQVGETVDLLGPLGTCFSPAKAGQEYLLVAGGIGFPPLYFQAREAVQQGGRVTMLYGVRSSERLAGIEQAGVLGIRIMATTEDGSAGRKGLVTDLLADWLTDTTASCLYACGPNRMLAAVAKLARARGVPAELALESHMGCGLGVCLACVIPASGVRRPASGIRDQGQAGKEFSYLRVCTEGPVFPAEVPVFEEIGW